MVIMLRLIRHLVLLCDSTVIETVSPPCTPVNVPEKSFSRGFWRSLKTLVCHSLRSAQCRPTNCDGDGDAAAASLTV